VIKYALLLEHQDRGRKKPVASSWRMDETYINVKGHWPTWIAWIDGSHSNALALHNINVELWHSGCMLSLVEILSIKYLNNIVEQSHRRVKDKMNQALGGGNLTKEQKPH
jgi:transposase-like protein